MHTNPPPPDSSERKPRSEFSHFWDYAKFGIPVTLLTTLAGMLLLLLLN